MVFLKILFYLIVLILVLILACCTTRMLGRGMARGQRTGGMEMLDQMALGRDSYLAVVKVQERIFLVGVSPAGVAKVGELDSYEKKEPAEAAPDFVAVLSSQMKRHIHGPGQKKKGGREKP